MKIQFTRDFYNPKDRKNINKNSVIEIEDEDNIPLDSFWRGIIKDNEITKIIQIIEPKNKK